MTPLAMQLAALDEDKVSPGLLGFTVVAVLAVATWILLKSMTKRLKRVDFEEKDIRGGDTGGARAGDPADGPDGTPERVGADAAEEEQDTAGTTPGAAERTDTAASPDAGDPADDRATRGNRVG
ncbi:hypothetical protein LO772_20830 [Yinghuangia sp. ASG 101]|uniref:hypothetical protein n=1 Tax=Yinghuangia sp. ASG 101 TaxID=2896848 RepID=UPI001E3E57D5|nr:hypothetical protein [Yinghuangia sp. ASG 101]UGQ09380.1 hypothetical protein LO772_20830 [Yinghuangia sp. ASG 101]